MLEDLKKNFDRLAALYEKERQRAGELDSSLNRCKAEIEAYKEQINDLKKQIDSRKLTDAFTAGGENTAAKERIDRLIREIDKCIALIEA